MGRTENGEVDEQFGKMVRDQYARGQNLHPILRAAAKGAIKNNLLSQTNVVFNDDVDGSSTGGVLFTVEGTPIKTTEVYTLIATPSYLLLDSPGIILVNQLAFVAICLLIFRLTLFLFGGVAEIRATAVRD